MNWKKRAIAGALVIAASGMGPAQAWAAPASPAALEPAAQSAAPVPAPAPPATKVQPDAAATEAAPPSLSVPPISSAKREVKPARPVADIAGREARAFPAPHAPVCRKPAQLAHKPSNIRRANAMNYRGVGARDLERGEEVRLARSFPVIHGISY